METETRAPVTPFPEMLHCCTSYCCVIRPVWYQVLQNYKIKPNSKVFTLETQYRRDGVRKPCHNLDIKTLLISHPPLYTHYSMCSTIYLACYTETIVVLVAPLPIQADISGIHIWNCHFIWSKHVHWNRKHREKDINRQISILSHKNIQICM